MKKLLFMVLCMVFGIAEMQAQSQGDTWKGKLDLGSAALSLVFHFATDANGQHIGTLDSPDQGAKGIAAVVETYTDSTLSVRIPTIGAQYTAVKKDNRWVGTFRQGGMALPLFLTRGELVRHRYQTPKPPFAYTEQEVSFAGGAPGVTLFGTLTLPKGYTLLSKGKVPAVLLISGSGQQNRDEELFDHKPVCGTGRFLGETRHCFVALRRPWSRKIERGYNSVDR